MNGTNGTNASELIISLAVGHLFTRNYSKVYRRIKQSSNKQQQRFTHDLLSHSRYTSRSTPDIYTWKFETILALDFNGAYICCTTEIECWWLSKNKQHKSSGMESSTHGPRRKANKINWTAKFHEQIFPFVFLFPKRRKLYKKTKVKMNNRISEIGGSLLLPMFLLYLYCYVLHWFKCFSSTFSNHTPTDTFAHREKK